MKEKKITAEEYEKAYNIVQKYEYQEKGTFQVTVNYNAEISVTLQVPKDWDNKKIKEELEGGPSYMFQKDDEPYIIYREITDLIVNGYKIDLNKL